MRSNFDVLRSIARHASYCLTPLSDHPEIEWEVRTADEPGTIHFPYCRVFRTTPVPVTSRRTIVDKVMGVNLSCYAGPRDTVDASEAIAAEIEDMLETLATGAAGAVLDPPVGEAAVATGGGGTLAAGAYRYVVTAVTRQSGESLASAPVSATLSATGHVALAWTAQPGAHAYRVYRGSPGAEHLIYAGYANAFTDNGSFLTGSRLPPTVSSAVIAQPMRIPLYDYAGVTLAQPATDQLNRPQHMDYLRVVDFNTTQIAEPDDPRNIAVVAALRVSWRRSALDVRDTATVQTVVAPTPVI